MQNEFRIKINTLDRAKELVKICDKYDESIDIKSGRYIVDAKSILGIFSFDITKPLTMTFYSNDKNRIKKFASDIKEYICDY